MRIYRHHLYEGGSQEYLKELNVSAHENTEAEGMNHLFSIVGIQKPEEEVLSVKKKWYQGRPILSWAILLLILLGCLFCDVIMTKDPIYMDLNVLQVNLLVLYIRRFLHFGCQWNVGCRCII